MILRLGALLLLAAGVWLLTQLAPSIRVPGVTSPAAVEPPQPGYYLRAAEMTEFGEDGRVRLRLAADTAAQDPATRQIIAANVRVDYLALPGQAWRLEARSGTFPPDSPLVQLQGSVVMSGTRAQQPNPAVIRTERLTLDTRQHLATTDAPVAMSLGPYVLDATGMTANLKAGTLRLESLVNGHFEP